MSTNELGLERPLRDKGFAGVRWLVLALIFFGTTFNYVDRLVMSVLASDLQAKFSMDDAAYGYIGSAFAICYAIGQVLSGKLLDRIGTRIGYAISLVAWSICAMATALGTGAWSFGFWRGALGLAESPSFPAAAKVCAEWFPRRQRAFAFGWVNAGANMAAITTPIIVPWLTLQWGWQAAFFYTGSLGLLLAVAWLLFFHRPEQHPWLTKREMAYIKSDGEDVKARKIPWLQLFRYRQVWVIAVGKFFSDGIWWFFMTWIPKFFRGHPYDLTLDKIGWPLVVIYLMADAGSVGGGWVSSIMVRRGWDAGTARRRAMLWFGCMALPIISAPYVGNLWGVVAIVGIATAGHQAFSSNLYTLCSDLFPKNAVASVAGFAGCFGYLSGAIFQAFTGNWVKYTGNYYGPFFCAGLAYVTAVAISYLILPVMKPAEVSEHAFPVINSESTGVDPTLAK